MRAAAALVMMFLALPVLTSAEPQKKRSADEALFQRWLVRHFAENSDPDDADLVYGYALIDLDGDGRNEAVVWARSGYRCGSGGCDLDVFVGGKSRWRLRSSTSITRPPIKVLSTRTHGWLDLAAWQAGGGIERPYEARLRFNGTEYQIESPEDWSGRKAPPPIDGQDIIKGATIPLFPTKCRPVREAPSTFGPLPLVSGPPGSC